VIQAESGLPILLPAGVPAQLPPAPAHRPDCQRHAAPLNDPGTGAGEAKGRRLRVSAPPVPFPGPPLLRLTPSFLGLFGPWFQTPA
jgi:hypothetical protein